MSTAEIVRSNVAQMKSGTVFLVNDLSSYDAERKATIRAMDNLVANIKLQHHTGTVNRIANGLYYKEQKSVLGNLPPSHNAVIDSLLLNNRKQVGFISGQYLFNAKGLSTQVPAVTTVVTSKQTPSRIDFAGIKIEVQRQAKPIEEKDIKRHEFEYILNNLGKVQSVAPDNIASALGEYFEAIDNKAIEFNTLNKHLIYKRSKALLGALMQDYQAQSKLDFTPYMSTLKQQLSYRSRYNFGHLSRHIDHHKQWNIEA